MGEGKEVWAWLAGSRAARGSAGRIAREIFPIGLSYFPFLGEHDLGRIETEHYVAASIPKYFLTFVDAGKKV